MSTCRCAAQAPTGPFTRCSNSFSKSLQAITILIASHPSIAVEGKRMKKTIGLMALVISAATALVPAAMARDWDDHDGDRGRYSYQVETRTDGYQRAYN